jgi:hypothetical protein
MSNLILPGSHSGDGLTVTGDFNEFERYDADHEKVSKEQMRVAQAIGAKLVKHYPNRQWKVIVDLKNCILIIACDSVSNLKGYHIHTIGRTLHDLEELSVKAAGEILERHAITRDKQFNPDNLEGLIRDQFDNVITPDSAAEPI